MNSTFNKFLSSIKEKFSEKSYSEFKSHENPLFYNKSYIQARESYYQNYNKKHLASH